MKTKLKSFLNQKIVLTEGQKTYQQQLLDAIQKKRKGINIQSFRSKKSVQVEK